MRGVGRRVLMAAVGLLVLAGYLAAAYLSYRALVAVWVRRPGPLLAALIVVAGTVALGYASYVYGTARVLSGLAAVEVPPERFPGLYARLDRLAAEMDLARPRLFVGHLDVPNALSMGGPRSGAVVIDRSLFRLLGPGELDAVIAHELAHIESRDGLVQTVAYSAVQTAVGLVLLAALPLVLLVTGVALGLAWIRGRPARWAESPVWRLRRRIGQAMALVLVALTLVVLAHSRSREFAADDRAVEVTGDPLALARALRTIQRASDPNWRLLAPLYVHGDEEGLLSRMLSTHPPMDDRIERLVRRAQRKQRRESGVGARHGR